MEVFRAVRVEQTIVHINAGRGEIHVRRFHTEVRPGTADQFDYIIETLRRLLITAIEHDSTVRT